MELFYLHFNLPAYHNILMLTERKLLHHFQVKVTICYETHVSDQPHTDKATAWVKIYSNE